MRNFGLVWVSGRAAGPELELALRSRARWEQVAADIPGIGFRAHGSITTAENAAELAVLTRAAALADAPARSFELLDPAGITKVNPGLAPAVAAGRLIGGLWCRADAIVEPRSAAVAIQRWLAARDGYIMLSERTVLGFADHEVRDQTGARHRGDLIVVCTGADHSGVAGAHLAAAPVRRVRLQMLQTERFPTHLTTSVADGDSLRYYPAFAGAGRDALGPASEMTSRWHSQLLLVQRLDGSLTIGDTHSYEEPFPFDVDQAPETHLRARAEAVLGIPPPPTRLRWAGVYSQVTDESLYHRASLADGVVLVTGPGGRGMTCSPGIAEDTFADVPAITKVGVAA